MTKKVVKEEEKRKKKEYKREKEREEDKREVERKSMCECGYVFVIMFFPQKTEKMCVTNH